MVRLKIPKIRKLYMEILAVISMGAVMLPFQLRPWHVTHTISYLPGWNRDTAKSLLHMA